MIVARTAARFRSAAGRCLVTDRYSGTVPSGSIVTHKVTKSKNNSFQVMVTFVGHKFHRDRTV